MCRYSEPFLKSLPADFRYYLTQNTQSVILWLLDEKICFYSKNQTQHFHGIRFCHRLFLKPIRFFKIMMLILNLGPGTGKTATTQEVIAALREEVDLGNLKKFRYIEINGMRMTTPKQVYSAIWSQLTGEKRTADHASELLEERFSGAGRKRENQPILMIVDELDQLMTRKQDVLYRIFDWPQRSKVCELFYFENKRIGKPKNLKLILLP
jgi:Cdc6-like AAA superfamily ATPase